MSEKPKTVVFLDNMRPFNVPPFARVAKERGLRTVLVVPPGKRPADTAALDLVLESDRWDLNSLRNIVDHIACEAEITAIVGTDFLVSRDGVAGAMCAALAKERGLPGASEDAIIRCVNKYLTRDALRAAGVPTVDFDLAVDEESAATAADRIGYPVILKPLTGAGSALVIKCKDQAEVRDAFRIAMNEMHRGAYWLGWKHVYPDRKGMPIVFDPDRCMLVEKYIAGPEASIECVAIGDEVHALIVHDKVRVVEETRAVYEDILVSPPVRFSPDEIAQLREYAVRAMKALGVVNSFAHVEVRFDESGPQLLEINPRVGGAYIADSLFTFRGIDTAQAQVALALGDFALPSATPLTEAPHAGFAFFPRGAGTLQRCDGIDVVRGLPGMLKVTQNYPLGSRVNGDMQEVFIVTAWMKGESLEHILSTYQQANGIIEMSVA